MIYNADFDFGVLERSRRIHELPHYPVAKFREGETERPYWWRGLNCAMEAHAQWYGSWSTYHKGYRWEKLTAAATHFGIDTSNSHRALQDALLALQVVKGMKA